MGRMNLALKFNRLEEAVAIVEEIGSPAVKLADHLIVPTYFVDYGNSFLKAVFDAGVRAVCRNGENDLDGFVFPSYVEDILGPCLFDFGYGPGSCPWPRCPRSTAPPYPP